jgi:hypothetical protein
MFESDSYYDEEDESESEEESERSDEEFYIEKYPELILPEPTQYYFKLETSHKDFIRSIVQVGDSIFLTASEDKSVKMFYF